ncbi:MAG: hemerythrin domain-containing protein [Anaerovoracaceae bacterium]
MDGITLMVEEHVNIKRMLAVLRKASLTILNGGDINFEDFKDMTDFVKYYADEHHHGKEEKFLFDRMSSEIGGAAAKLVTGMLIEHDQGRLYMMDLKAALEKVKAGDEEAKVDVIANAVSYTHLLNRHIDKEDSAAYPFARRGLSEETLNTINDLCETFEKEQEEKGIQEQYMKTLERLEKVYGCQTPSKEL